MTTKGGLAPYFATLKRLIVPLFLISGVINLLALTGAMYMLQVYDRVLSSGSVETLVLLSVLAIGLYALQGLLDGLRFQIMSRAATETDGQLAKMAQTAALRLPLAGSSASDAIQPIRDVETIRSFVASPGPLALLDIVWMPVFLIFVFVLHPVLGFMTLGGMLLLIGVTSITDWRARSSSAAAQTAGQVRLGLVDAHANNAEAIRAMGMEGRAWQRFAQAHGGFLRSQVANSDVVISMGGLARTLRMIMQSAVLGVAAYLTLIGALSAGAIVASSIVAARALAPIDHAIAHWKAFTAARQGAERLARVFALCPIDRQPLDLPAPQNSLSVENITVVAPGTGKIILNNASFSLTAGQAVGIIGPSASGKSTLTRALLGIWPLARGEVRLDGAALESFALEARGRFFGFLPQDVQLFDGSITENIARFDPTPDPTAVLRAAQSAGVHEVILRLPQGYETRIGPKGASLSSGQRQRIALARALYGDPFLIVLDEPNSNLDAEGEAALNRAILNLKARGGIAVIVAHRPSALAAVDYVARMQDGRLVAFGRRDEVLRDMMRQRRAVGQRDSLEATPSLAEQEG